MPESVEVAFLNRFQKARINEKSQVRNLLFGAAIEYQNEFWNTNLPIRKKHCLHLKPLKDVIL